MLFLIPVIFFLILGALGVHLWVEMTKILEKKGLAPLYFWVSPGQLFQLNQVIQTEEDPARKRSYQYVLWGQVAIILVYLVAMYVVLEVFH